MLALTGAGLGLFTPANNATVASAGRHEHAGMVSGVLNMTRGIGTAFGVAVTGATFTLASVTGAHAAARGFQARLLVLAVLAGVAAWLCAHRGVPHVTRRAEATA